MEKGMRNEEQAAKKPTSKGEHLGPSSYPFRYYGSECDDWIEGGEGSHCFTVQFKRAPKDEELTALGRLYAESLTTGQARPSDKPWEWSGRFALFYVGERGCSEGAHIGSVTRFLRQAHEIIAIEDAVYFNAREGTGSWDKWSMALGRPDAGPFVLNQVGMYPRPYDASLGEPKTNKIFEAARHTMHVEIERAKLLDALAKDADGPVRLELVSDDLPAAGRRRRKKGKRKRVKPKWPSGMRPRDHSNRAYHPSEDEQIVGNGQELFRVDLNTGDVKPLALPPKVKGIDEICFLRAGARLLLSCEKRLVLIDPAAESPAVLATVRRSGWHVFPLLNGDGFGLQAPYDKRGVVIYAVNGHDKIKQIASSTAQVTFHLEKEGRIFFRYGTPSGYEHLEFLGIAEAVGEHVASPR